MPVVSNSREGNSKRRSPGNQASSEQSRRALLPAVPKVGEDDVPLPAHAKFAQVRFDPFISAQSLQLRKAHQHQNPAQTETRRSASRVAGPSRRIAPAVPRKSETDSHSTDSTLPPNGSSWQAANIPRGFRPDRPADLVPPSSRMMLVKHALLESA